MAYTVLELETIITKLETAIPRAELTVEYSDRRVTYRSVDEQLTALQYFKGLLAAQSGTTRPKQSFAVAGKGFGG